VTGDHLGEFGTEGMFDDGVIDPFKTSSVAAPRGPG